MMTASQFVDAIGRKTIQAVFGAKPTAISNAVVRGVLPSRWFFTSQKLAEEVGVECPPELFGQLPDLRNTQNVDSKQSEKACTKRQVDPTSAAAVHNAPPSSSAPNTP